MASSEQERSKIKKVRTDGVRGLQGVYCELSAVIECILRILHMRACIGKMLLICMQDY
jgi:hypothetical protein